MSRLFLAATLPQEILARLQEIDCSFPGARPVPPEQLHLTLRFVGEVEEAEVVTLCRQLEKVRSGTVTITLGGIGIFTRGKQPTAVWLGVQEDGALSRLKRGIDTALTQALPLPRERFTPHLTLARLKNCAHGQLQEFIAAHNLLKSPPFAVESFRLYQSQLTPKRAIHTLVAEYPLQHSERVVRPGALE